MGAKDTARARLEAMATDGTAGVQAFDAAQAAAEDYRQQAVNDTANQFLWAGDSTNQREPLDALISHRMGPAFVNVNEGADLAHAQVGYDAAGEAGYLRQGRESLADRWADWERDEQLARQRMAEQDRQARMSLSSSSSSSGGGGGGGGFFGTGLNKEEATALIAGAGQMAQDAERERLNADREVARRNAATATKDDAFKARDAVKALAKAEASTPGWRNLLSEVARARQSSRGGMLDAARTAVAFNRAGKNRDSGSRYEPGRGVVYGSDAGEREARERQERVLDAHRARRAPRVQAGDQRIAEVMKSYTDRRSAGLAAASDARATAEGVQADMGRRMDVLNALLAQNDDAALSVASDPDRFSRDAALELGIPYAAAMGLFPSDPQEIEGRMNELVYGHEDGMPGAVADEAEFYNAQESAAYGRVAAEIEGWDKNEVRKISRLFHVEPGDTPGVEAAIKTAEMVSDEVFDRLNGIGTEGGEQHTMDEIIADLAADPDLDLSPEQIAAILRLHSGYADEIGQGGF